MNKHLPIIATVACLAFLACPALADQGNMHPGGYADRMFKDMDANNDGTVTKKEFSSFNDQRFKDMDANKDGKVTREEMDAYADKMREQMRGQMQEHFKQRFNEADANHDGALSKDEAQKMPMVSQHFDEIDANKDGKVTIDEIRAAHQKMDEEMHGSCPVDGKGKDGCGQGGGMHHHGGMMKQ